MNSEYTYYLVTFFTNKQSVCVYVCACVNKNTTKFVQPCSFYYTCDPFQMCFIGTLGSR